MAEGAVGPQHEPHLSSFEDFLADAATLLELGRPEEAGRSAGWAVAAAPADPRGWWLLSLAHSGLGEGRLALEAASQAVARDPLDAAMHRRASECLSAVGLAQQAVVAATEAVRLDPLIADGHARLAVALAVARPRQLVFGRQLGRGSRAATQHAERAVALAPASATAHFAAGFVAAAAGEPQLARGHYSQALAIDPTMAAAQNNLAQLDLSRGRFRDGGAGFAGAVRTNPRFDRARRNVERTVYAQLLVHHALAAVVYVGFAMSAAGAAAATGPAYRVQPGPRGVAAVLVLVGSAGWAAWTWRRSATPVRLIASRMAATRGWLWLVAILDTLVVGCFVAGAAGVGAAVAGVYGAGLIAMPVIALSVIASREQAR